MHLPCRMQVFIDYYNFNNSTWSSSTKYHDNVAKEVQSSPSYTNHASATTTTLCAVRHRRGERRRRHDLYSSHVTPAHGPTRPWTCRRHPHHTNTMHGDVKRRLKTTTHSSLIGGALWAWLAGVINWEPSEAPGTMKTTLPKLDRCQQAHTCTREPRICISYKYG
jgi:hypothetical protein